MGFPYLCLLDGRQINGTREPAQTKGFQRKFTVTVWQTSSRHPGSIALYNLSVSLSLLISTLRINMLATCQAFLLQDSQKHQQFTKHFPTIYHKHSNVDVHLTFTNHLPTWWDPNLTKKTPAAYDGTNRQDLHHLPHPVLSTEISQWKHLGDVGQDPLSQWDLVMKNGIESWKMGSSHEFRRLFNW